MTSDQYLKSPERRALYNSHPQRNILGPVKDRLKEVSHADVCNWAELFNGGVIPEGLT